MGNKKKNNKELVNKQEKEETKKRKQTDTEQEQLASPEERICNAIYGLKNILGCLIGVNIVIGLLIVFLCLIGFGVLKVDVDRIKDAQAEQKIQLEQMQEQMQEQETQLEQMSEQMEKVSKMVTSVYNESNYAVFANAVFGYYDYHCYDMNNNKFYYDTDCEKEISGKVYFRNRWPESGQDSEGNFIHCYMMSDGRICYIPSSENVDMSW